MHDATKLLAVEATAANARKPGAEKLPPESLAPEAEQRAAIGAAVS